MSATESGIESAALVEARRTMEICNACRYCEGYCPVFPAMERRRVFTGADLAHLANLCHDCRGCWFACQYAPPHEFALNLPSVFAELRAERYAAHAWPAWLGALFERNGFKVTLLASLALGLVMILALVLVDGATLTAVHRGPGAFYAVIPYAVMVSVAGLTFGYAVIAMLMGARGYWRASGAAGVHPADVLAGLRAAAVNRHLAGAGEGCNDVDERFGQARRYFHLAMMWGFLLCFAATAVATVMDHLFGWPAPYALYSLPVLLGSVGGLGLMVGTAGLFSVKLRADRAPAARRTLGMDCALLVQLFLVAATGMVLLALRETGAMGIALAIHLGFVLGLFLVLPYGKFVHGVYRVLALVREAGEQRRERARVDA